MSNKFFKPPDGFKRLYLELAWDGLGYSGWQIQKNANSVQETLQGAIVSLGGKMALSSVAAGRTDAGVHAQSMPIHWDVPILFDIPENKLARALNSFLPPSIAVQSARLAPAGFHARFSCLERRYVYRLLVNKQRHPLWEGRALHVFSALDIEAMNDTACVLIGTHDFAAFATQEERQTVRELRYLKVEQNGSLWEIHVHGESFLRHMVRGLVGTLLLVGSGRLSEADVKDILLSRDRAKAGVNVAPHGLYFAGALYDNL